jgi:nucleotide-binding universal stress UspA family protein
MNDKSWSDVPRILVTLDGSPLSEGVLDTVRQLAGRLGARVELLRVARLGRVHDTPGRDDYQEIGPVATATGTQLRVPLPSALVAPPVETREQKIARIEAHFRDYLLDRARELNGIPTTVAVAIADDSCAAIIAHARATQPDLIAMATHGRSGAGHLLAGSVCEKVVRSGVAPVVVVCPR